MFLKSNTYRPNSEIKLDKLSDEKIIQEYLKSQNSTLIAVLFDRYIHLVFASCMKYLKDEESARDMAMEIFESIPEKLIKHTVEYFKSWLFVTTKNACLMQLRKNNPVDRVSDLENIIHLSVENEGDEHLTHTDENRKSCLLSCLKALKEEQRLCVELMYMSGNSYKDITEKTGFELKQVKSFIQNGKRNLKLMMDKHYEGQ